MDILDDLLPAIKVIILIMSLTEKVRFISKDREIGGN